MRKEEALINLMKKIVTQKFRLYGERTAILLTTVHAMSHSARTSRKDSPLNFNIYSGDKKRIRRDYKSFISSIKYLVRREFSKSTFRCKNY